MFIWILYYDNLPKYRFGAIKQQLWMLLHLPLHVGILGIAEGSQQLALARYYIRLAEKFVVPVWYGCYKNHLDGDALGKNLTAAVEYLKLNESRAEGQIALMDINAQIKTIVNTTGICAASNMEPLDNGLSGLPMSLSDFIISVYGGIFSSLGLDIDPKSNIDAAVNASHAFRIVYTYYWSAILLLLLCLTISALLADRGFRLARFRVTSLIGRSIASAFAVFALVYGLRHDGFYSDYLASSWVLPTAVLMLWVVCIGDRTSKFLRRRKEGRDARYEAAPRGSDEEDMLGGESRGGYVHAAGNNV